MRRLLKNTFALLLYATLRFSHEDETFIVAFVYTMSERFICQRVYFILQSVGVKLHLSTWFSYASWTIKLPFFLSPGLLFIVILSAEYATRISLVEACREIFV